MKKALVTGGSGFIGSHLVDWLLNVDIEVVVLDNLSSGTHINPEATFIQLDLCDEWKTKQAIGMFKPDVVFHLAAHANLPKSVNEPTLDARSNIMGSISLFEACRNNNIEKLVYASTAGGIYAGAYDDEHTGFAENTPERPLSPYGVSKLSVEKYLRSFYQNYFSHTTLRLPNVYGPRRNPESGAGVVSIFSRNIVEGKPCYMYGGGALARDYVYVSDVVLALYIAARPYVRRLYNIGSGQPVFVTEIADILSEYATEQGYEPQFVEAQIRDGEATFIQIDSSLFREETGWQPTVQLKEGIKSTFDWVRGNAG
jgi:UDP-glucose 4-epimerase